MPSKKPPAIHVIAGVNGAGKSSIQGALIVEGGGTYYNPDEAARKIIDVTLVSLKRQLTVSPGTKAWNC